MASSIHACADHFVVPVAVNIAALCRPTRAAKIVSVERRATRHTIARSAILHQEEMRGSFLTLVVNGDDGLILAAVRFDQAHIANLIAVRDGSDELSRGLNRERLCRRYLLNGRGCI